MASFLNKPVSEGDGNLVVLLPPGARDREVKIQTPAGEEVGRYVGNTNGNRPTFRFTRPGSAYGGGGQVIGNQGFERGVNNFGSREEGGGNFAGSAGGGDFNAQFDPENQAFVGESAGGNPIVAPNFADFESLAFREIDPAQSVNFGFQTGEQNREIFLENFGLSDALAANLLDSEARELQNFVNRTAPFIRDQTAQDNTFNLQESLRFDENLQQRIDTGNEFNRGQISGANQFNIRERLDALEGVTPGIQGVLNRAISRNEERASRDLLNEAQQEVLDRSSRNRAADIGTAGGFGASSTLTNSLLDTVALQDRIALEEREQIFQLRGEDALRGSVNQATGTLLPNLVEQNPQVFQAAPVPQQLSQVGSQIRPTPTRDAATIRQGLTNDITNLQAVNPNLAAELDFNAQDRNAQRDLQVQLQKLGFEQEQNNAIAGAIAGGIRQDQAIGERDFAASQFQAGLNQATQSDLIGLLGSLGGAALSNPQIRQTAGNIISSLGGFGADLFGSVYSGVFGDDSAATTSVSVPAPDIKVDVKPGDVDNITLPQGIAGPLPGDVDLAQGIATGGFDALSGVSSFIETASDTGADFTDTLDTFFNETSSILDDFDFTS